MAIPYLTAATLPYGSRVLTISAVGYIANSFSPSQSLQVIERQDSLGAPNGAIGIRAPRTGSASLQLASTSTTSPTVGDEFTASVGGSTVTFFLTEVGLPESQNGFKTVEVSFREAI